MLKNKYGYFDEESGEFVITDPHTPRPWFNYMWNDNYGGLISHSGGGFSFMASPRDNRINRMRYNCLPWDRPGRYVMIKDPETGRYWSLSWAPTLKEQYEHYECRHGQGYTAIQTTKDGISAQITYFVPPDHNGEIWQVRLKNDSASTRGLQLYAFTELLMGNALNDLINQPNDKHFTDIHFDDKRQALLATRRYWVLNRGVTVKQPNLSWPYLLSFSSSLPVTGYDASLDAFIGKWRSEADPVNIEKGRMTNTEITAGEPIAALQNHVLLDPGEEVELHYSLLIHDKNTPLPDAAEWQKLRSNDHWNSQFTELRSIWSKRLAAVKVETPDEAFNMSMNTWNPYQSWVTFEMARNAGYYHGGLLFGTGMRDRFQDILAVLISEPERVRPRLLDALQYQFSNGSTLHNFFKLTGTGEKTDHSDTPLWIPFGLVWYLKESADWSILDEKVPYHDGGEGRVEEHLHRALDHALEQTTDRGLPRIMNGDWNDTLDHIGPEGKGETVWGAFFLGYVLHLAAEMYRELGDQDRSGKYLAEYNKLKTTVNELAWDGDWYLRAFRDNGQAVGSAKDEQGKIFLNAQSWAVISGFAPDDRREKLLDSAEKFLLKPQGMQICWPSYTAVDDSVGLISRCVPGKKENGAVFNHASSWFVMAAALAGRNELAWKVYQRMLPMNVSANIDRYETEPYVFSEYVTSPDHVSEGQASHSWLTGSSVWMYRIGLDIICGIRPDFKGIHLSPALPPDWNEIRVKRTFRGKKLNIHIRRSAQALQTTQEITLNGRKIDGNFISEDQMTAENTIETTL